MLISNSQITHEESLSQVTKITSELNEHQHRLGQLPHQKSVHAQSLKVETRNGQGNDKQETAAVDNSQTIQQLSAQVDTLIEMVASLIEQQATKVQELNPQTSLTQKQLHPQSCSPSQPSSQARGRTARCPKCSVQNQEYN